MNGVPRTAYLRGGRGDGRDVDVPLDDLPELLDYVDAAGTVPYQRVGNTAEYRPATVLDKLAPAPKAAAPKAAARKAAPPVAPQWEDGADA